MSARPEFNPRDYEYRPGLLKNRNILITGASDGIGKALALCSAQLGARVILHGRNIKKLEGVYDEIQDMNGAARPSIVPMDLATADSDGYLSLADSIANEFGQLDGLVHNAGILGEKISIEQYDAVMWQRVMHVNVTAAFALTQVCLPLLRDSPDPSIIFTSSGVGRSGRAFWGAYSVSKFATEGLCQILADENKHTSLRVNCVNPGATRTNMRLAAYPAENRDLLKTPEQVLPVYIYLLGPDSQGVSGESLDAQ
jgi:NAD(P)-dependent dehydrogenase (short-subunit alcohol dehydrogenase family)